MSLLIKKRQGIFSLTGIARLSVVCLISYLGISLIDTLWAVKLEQEFTSSAYLSFFSAFLGVISFTSYFFLIPLIERNSKSKLYFFSTISLAIGYGLFYFTSNVYLFILLSAITTIITALKITSFGIIIRDKSKPRELSRNEGVIWSFFNLSWLIGPLIAGLLAEKYGINSVFLVAGFILLISALSFRLFGIRDNNIKKDTDYSLLKNFKEYFSDSKRIDAYVLGGGGNFWFILVFLYMPLMMLQEGLHERWIGYFIVLSTLPLILTEFKMSKLAGEIGFKKIFKRGYLILTFCAILAFIFYGNIYITIAILALSSFGVAMIEPTAEAYFFDILKDKKQELKYYGPYNTSIDVSYIVGKVLAGILLIYLPFRYLFLFFAVFMFGYYLYCFKIKEVRESLRKR